MTRHGEERRSGEDRREAEPETKIRWSIIVQVVGWVVGLFMIYNAMDRRLTTVETNRQNDTLRMERIESKLDRLLEQERK